MRRVDGRLEYMFRQANDWPNQVIAEPVALERWPLLVLDFLQCQVEIVSVDASERQRVDFLPVEADDQFLFGNPISIHCNFNFISFVSFFLFKFIICFRRF